ncbi:MAG: holin [Erysipelotrichaceae bacterium]|nr:holin [Lachnospiraceae bacterium]MBE6119337.1 holin [Erysipelotrichaceae bacterium]
MEIDIIELIKTVYIPIVMLACMGVGYCIKHVKKFDAIANEYIPIILAALGVVLGCVAKQEITLNAIVGGLISGLLAVGLHQFFKQIIEKNKNQEG